MHPKIFAFANANDVDRFHSVQGFAISEDGKILAEHISSSLDWLKSDLDPEKCGEDYRAHYPDGFRFEFVSPEEAKEHQDLQTAMKLYLEGLAEGEPSRITTFRDQEPAKEPMSAEIAYLMATIVGANELVKQATSFGERLFWRMIREEMLKMARTKGFKEDFIRGEGHAPVLSIPANRPVVTFIEKDIEDMRATVALWDAQHPKTEPG